MKEVAANSGISNILKQKKAGEFTKPKDKLFYHACRELILKILLQPHMWEWQGKRSHDGVIEPREFVSR